MDWIPIVQDIERGDTGRKEAEVLIQFEPRANKCMVCTKGGLDVCDFLHFLHNGCNCPLVKVGLFVRRHRWRPRMVLSQCAIS